MQLPPLSLAQALPCLSMAAASCGTVDSDILAGVTAIIGLWLSTRACLTILFPTALLGFLLWALPCVSNGTRLTVVFLTFSVLAQGGGGVRHMTSQTFITGPLKRGVH